MIVGPGRPEDTLTSLWMRVAPAGLRTTSPRSRLPTPESYTSGSTASSRSQRDLLDLGRSPVTPAGVDAAVLAAWRLCRPGPVQGPLPPTPRATGVADVAGRPRGRHDGRRGRAGPGTMSSPPTTPSPSSKISPFPMYGVDTGAPAATSGWIGTENGSTGRWQPISSSPGTTAQGRFSRAGPRSTAPSQCSDRWERIGERGTRRGAGPSTAESGSPFAGGASRGASPGI